MKNYFNVLQDEDDEEFVMVENENNANSTDPNTAKKEEKGKGEESPALEDGEILEDQVVPGAHKKHQQHELEDGEIVDSQKLNHKKSVHLSKQPQYSIDLQFDFSSEFSELDQSKSFNDTWVLWYDNTKKAKTQTSQQQPDENSLYLQSLKKVGSFNNVQTLNELWSSLTSPMDTNISIFKDGIEPAWESEKNKDGGKYSVNYILKDNIEYAKVLNSWFTLVTSIVFASQWENYDQTNGIVISFRSWGVSISLWNSDSENQEKVNSLRDALQNLLKVKYTKYSSHNNTILLKTFKKNDEKKKKMNYKFQKNNNLGNNHNNNNGGFDGYNNNGNNGQFGGFDNHNSYFNNYGNSQSWSDNTEGNDGVFGKGFNTFANNGSNGTWTSQIKKIKPLTLSSSGLQHQPVVAPVVVPTEPSVPVPEIPAGMNAWATGILLGKEPIPLQTPFVAKRSESAAPTAEEPTVAVAAGQPQEEPQVEEKKVVEKTHTPVIPPSVNAWSTGLLLPKSATPVVETAERSEEPVAPVKEKKEKKEKKPDSSVNAWSTGMLVSKKAEEEKEVVAAEPKREKKEQKAEKQEKKRPLKTSDEKVETSFWEANPIAKEDWASKAAPTAPATVAPQAEQSRERKRQARPNASPVIAPAPVSLWEQKDNVLKLMETISVEQTTTVASVEVVSQQVVSAHSGEESTRLTLQIKADKKVKVQEIHTVAATSEWTAVEEKKPKKERKEDDNSSNTKKEKTPSTYNQKEEKTSLIHALSVEEPIEYKTPIKPKSSSTSTSVPSINKKDKPANKTKVSKPASSPSTSTSTTKVTKKVTTSSNPLDIQLIGISAVVLVLLIAIIYKFVLN